MKRFFEAELKQRDYQPKPCDPGQGIAADGTISWTGGPARYVYVLEIGSQGPTATP